MQPVEKPTIGEKIKSALGMGHKEHLPGTTTTGQPSEYERTIAKDIPVVGTAGAAVAPAAVPMATVGPTTGFTGSGAQAVWSEAEAATLSGGQVIQHAPEIRQEAPVVVSEAPIHRVAEAEFRQLPTEFRGQAGVMAGGVERIIEEKPVITERQVIHERPLVTEKPVLLQKDVITEQPVLHEKEVVHREVPIVREQHVMRDIPLEQQREVIAERPVVQETHRLEERHVAEVLPTQVEVSERRETLPLQVEQLPTVYTTATEPLVSGLAQVPPAVGAPITGVAAPAPAELSGLPAGHLHHAGPMERAAGAAGTLLGEAAATAERGAEKLTGHPTHAHHHGSRPLI